jgi:mRNA interferase MazF
MKRGDIYWANLDPTVGAEIKKKRPCVIVSANTINKFRKTVVVIPLSTSAKSYPPITVTVNCDQKKVTAVCDQIRAVDKTRLLKLFSKLSQHDLKQIDDNLHQVLNL